MALAEPFRQQVALLVRLLPFIAPEKCFALKGGTAINLFIRDLPRLSVDIDLTYVPVSPRPKSLAGIDNAMGRIAARVEKAFPRIRVQHSQHEGATTKLIVRDGKVQVKIEVTPVLRGCVFAPEQRSASPAVEAAFGFVEVPVVSFADLYAGKLVAALDRQHPRDLFDVRQLLANEGLTPDIRTAFLVYLVSHHRPMAEVLAARPKDISKEYAATFVGMTAEPVALSDLIAARESLVDGLIGQMPADHRRFLVGFERGTPDWTLLGLPPARKLPAVQWRQKNLNTLSAPKRAALVEHLASVLNVAVPTDAPPIPMKKPARRKRSKPST